MFYFITKTPFMSLKSYTVILLSQKVFMEAEEMAKKYRAKMPTVTTRSEITDHPPITSSFPQGKDEEIYANWDWFKFESQ